MTYQLTRPQRLGGIIRAIVLLAAAVAGLWSASSGAASAPPRVPQQILLNDVAPGPDAVWFGERRAFGASGDESWIGRITPSGVVTEFRARLPLRGSLAPGGDPAISDLAVGADGDVWFVGNSLWIGRLSRDGAVRAYPSGSAGLRGFGGISFITAGPDGHIWFIGAGGRSIGRITSTGALLRFPLPAREAAIDITAGPDGRLWFVRAARRSNGWVEGIAAMTTTGDITAFEPLTAPSFTSEIANLTPGPDGNVWFTMSGQILRITPAGDVSGFPARIGPDREISALTSGSDGNLWFASPPGFDNPPAPVGRMTPTGAVRFFRTGVGVGDMTAGPDGNLWFTELNLERIGRMTPTGAVSEFPPAPRISGMRSSSDCDVHPRRRSPAAERSRWRADPASGPIAGKASHVSRFR